MKRDCFLCGSECETLRQADWSLPHLATHSIGFGLCGTCGLGLQTSSVAPEQMTRYYTESAVYTNPGRAGMPTGGKQRGVERALALVKATVDKPLRSVYQVGSSDGYTLSRFKDAGAELVGGVEPSRASCEMAQQRYGINTTLGTVEETELPGEVDLWILTHVLEHLYDPLSVLNRIRQSQEVGAWVLVEVPLLEQAFRFPPSYLTFEHLNYFSEGSLLHLLTRAGYVADQVEKDFSSDQYPIIRVLARASGRKTGSGMRGVAEVQATRECMLHHMARESCSWARVEARVRAELSANAPVWLWGAGIHSSQMLAQTQLEDYLDIRGLLDSSPIRHGQKFGPYRIHDPSQIDFRDGAAIVISSHAAEEEIWKALSERRAAGVPVVRLYSQERGLSPELRARQGAA